MKFIKRKLNESSDNLKVFTKQVKAYDLHEYAPGDIYHGHSEYLKVNGREVKDLWNEDLGGVDGGSVFVKYKDGGGLDSFNYDDIVDIEYKRFFEDY